jgi:hypothetical protein
MRGQGDRGEEEEEQGGMMGEGSPAQPLGFDDNALAALPHQAACKTERRGRRGVRDEGVRISCQTFLGTYIL